MPDRLTDWRGPTGRWLRPGTTFKVHGQRGTWKFVALVRARRPYVEAVSTDRGRGNVRCFDPDKIHTVSNLKGTTP